MKYWLLGFLMVGCSPQIEQKGRFQAEKEEVGEAFGEGAEDKKKHPDAPPEGELVELGMKTHTPAQTTETPIVKASPIPSPSRIPEPPQPSATLRPKPRLTWSQSSFGDAESQNLLTSGFGAFSLTLQSDQRDETLSFAPREALPELYVRGAEVHFFQAFDGCQERLLDPSSLDSTAWFRVPLEIQFKGRSRGWESLGTCLLPSLMSADLTFSFLLKRPDSLQVEKVSSETYPGGGIFIQSDSTEEPDVVFSHFSQFSFNSAVLGNLGCPPTCAASNVFGRTARLRLGFMVLETKIYVPSLLRVLHQHDAAAPAFGVSESYPDLRIDRRL